MPEQARRLLEVIAVSGQPLRLSDADRHKARFEHAQTLLARGRVGQQHGWPEAPQDLATARQALRDLEAGFALDEDAAGAK